MKLNQNYKFENKRTLHQKTLNCTNFDYFKNITIKKFLSKIYSFVFHFWYP